MAIKKRHEEHENHERWLVSYADFITLLFAFFVVLYATSSADQAKQKEVETSIKASFGGMGGQGDDLQAMRNRRYIRELDGAFPPKSASAIEVQNYVENRLEEEMGDDKDETVTGVRHDVMGVRIQVAAEKLFPSGSAELLADSMSALDKLGRMLKDSDRRIIIEGHTDDEPIKNEKFPSNWELSASRATKIVRYLVARFKIPASRLAAVAYADQKPVVPNTSDANRTRNRRIEILIVTGNSEEI